MENIKTSKPSYFFVIAVVGIFAVFIGFSKTFIAPLYAGTFSAPLPIYIHGVFAFSWVLLFFVQVLLINFSSYSVHMTLGIFGILIALGTAITMLPAGLYAVQKELKQGLGDTAISGIVGVATSSIMFLSIVIAGVYNRRRGDIHKRLMLLATLVVLWPAWFRFRHYFPSVNRPEIWFAVVLADFWILLSCIWDKLRNGKVHPVFIYVGAFIILEHTFEVIYFDSPGWRTVAKSIYQLLS